MSIEQDQNYLDACKIVEAYERAVRFERNELSILMMMESNLDFMEEILSSTESALNEMDIVDDLAPDRETEVEPPQEVLSESQQEEKNSCAEEKDFVSLDGATINFNIPDEDLEIDLSTPLVDPVNAIDEFFGGDGEVTAQDIKDAARECFDCDLKVEFDFQIKPINLLSEIMPLLNKIGAILDNIINELKPFDLLANLCNLSKNIRIFCLPDLLSILVTLEGLIKRYMGDAFKLVLNWTFIIGPIIKGIVDIAATLMEQIRRLLVAPLDCAAGVIGSMLNFAEKVEGSFENMQAFAAAFPNYDSKTESNVLSRTMRFAQQPEVNDMANVFRKNDKEPASETEMNVPFAWEFSINDTLESAYQKEKEHIKAKKRLRKRQELVRNTNDPARRESIFRQAEKIVTGKVNGDVAFNGTEAELKAIEKEFARLAEQENQGLLKKLLFSINEGKAWVNSLHANLLLSLKTLNALVANNLEISFKLGGWILMIFDIIKVVQLVVHSFKSGSFKSICDIMENDPERLKDILDRDFKWAAVDLEETQKKLDEWEKQLMIFSEQEDLITCE